MKKILLTFLIIVAIFGTYAVFAQNVQDNKIENNVISEITEFKKNQSEELKEYTEKYGSETYGYTAYILSRIQVYSIPFCFLSIAVGAIYQYVIGIRRLDIRDKGFFVVIASITVCIICQVLPLIFALVVRGWRG